MSGETDISRIVTFRVGGDLFAAPIERVERVLRYEPPRRVPGTPDWVEGVIDYRGRAVPLVDLRRRFGVANGGQPSQSRVLVLSSAEAWLAVIVDAVLDVRALDAKSLEAPPTFFRGSADDAMRGMTRRDESLVVVLDVDRLFAPDFFRVAKASPDEQRVVS